MHPKKRDDESRYVHGVRMKYLILTLSLIISTSLNAGSINSIGTYNGKIKSVAVGHWNNVGIELEGVQCNGHNEVILLADNTLFNAHLSVLLAAQASQQTVVLYRVESTQQEFSPNYTYCIISHAAIGDFTTW
jgi:hypothetical protein